MQIKVCGMRERENILALEREIAPDWMGLIFYPNSARFVSKAESLPETKLRRVGVFVNESEEEILKKVEEYGLSAIQLHGKESVDFVKGLAQKTDKEIWKVISVKDRIDWESLSGYLPFISKFLFDTATVAHGGSGKKFDWSVLESYPFDKGFFLSGGLDESSADEVLALAETIPQLEGVDLNSKFEDEPALKNIEKLKSFKKRLLGQ
ncbi:phosphoribosylanthranilate isomerase [Algoriphagus chordae]|uniref:N-(5'-phosphoribosyl)anthranilate isomerase n=1 Tax=Algoriphagus chordae TaxID=237019 RepID=A0A2W7QYV0_9BACT|nr:phosphoribosylanthranilate isomerase [Algoriphagus chordae]PZX48867.1 phosphoribosylanthranilate isomerase [Algoriphagus chordae]